MPGKPPPEASVDVAIRAIRAALDVGSTTTYEPLFVTAQKKTRKVITNQTFGVAVQQMLDSGELVIRSGGRYERKRVK
jgi:hypothetical protein